MYARKKYVPKEHLVSNWITCRQDPKKMLLIYRKPLQMTLPALGSARYIQLIYSTNNIASKCSTT